jgi:alkanesulfonate monooxygenase SsuD/methylene tetrahydromethanopterin reductase-like flavin-dependent oxidoreductase (luciferase family)
MRAGQAAIVGTPEEVVAQLRGYEEAGVAELAARWFDAEDVEGLELLATDVLPRLGHPTA